MILAYSQPNLIQWILIIVFGGAWLICMADALINKRWPK
jgi:hypothetical protein